jgi:hypothetical protein
VRRQERGGDGHQDESGRKRQADRTEGIAEQPTELPSHLPPPTGDCSDLVGRHDVAVAGHGFHHRPGPVADP